MSRRKQTVWVVMHYEYMGSSMEDCWLDALQFHVSSSLKKAEKYIQELRVDAHSWWQIHPHVLDANDFREGDEVHYYSHRGTPLSAAPHRRAVAAFRKHCARNPELYRGSSSD